MSDRPFNSDEPIAYFITWTTYGSWLSGDERGWRKKVGSDIESPNAFIRTINQSEMKEAKFLLSQIDRQTVEATIRHHCEIRNWQLHASSARSNHVHVVVSASGYQPETVRDQFKAWCTRKLKPAYPGRQRFWTKGASCRWINQNDDLDSAIVYTNEAQDRMGQSTSSTRKRASEWIRTIESTRWRLGHVFLAQQYSVQRSGVSDS